MNSLRVKSVASLLGFLMKPATMILAFAVLLGGMRQAQAVPITYTVSDTASGTVGTTSFTNALVTVSFSGDTTNVFPLVPGFLENTIGTATISISGIGTATFTDAMYAAVNQTFSPPVAGIADSSCGGCPGVALGTFNSSAFGSYDLQSAIGPISGLSDFRTDLSYGTTAGLVNFSAAGVNSTFTATTVSEPSSILMLGSGILALAGVLRRKLIR